MKLPSTHRPALATATLHPRAHAILSLARALPAFGLLAWPSAALAAPVVAVPAESRAEAAPRTGAGDGLCVQLAAAASAGTISNSALAAALLSQTPGGPAQAAPSGVNNGVTNIFGVAGLLDYTNDTATSSGGFPFDVLFPWSKSAGGEICQSHQPVTPVVRSSFAARYSGLLNIRTAGAKTFAIASDDGYALRIGGTTVAELQNNRDAAVDTRRASFAQPGVYPFELVFWSSAGDALLEIAMAEGEVVFLANSRATPDLTGAVGNDLTSATPGAFADGLGFRVLGDGLRERGILFVADADKTASRCGPLLGSPNDLCTLDDVARLCGNGIIDARASGGAEACDDGNETNDDGCSSTCQVEPGNVCAGIPSACMGAAGGAGAGGAGAGGAGAGGAGGAAGDAGAAGAAGAGGATTGGEGGVGGGAGDAGAGGVPGNGGGGAGGSEAAGAGGDASGGGGQPGTAGAGGTTAFGGAGAGGLAGIGGSGTGGLAGVAGSGTGGLAGVAGTGGFAGAGVGGTGTAGNAGAGAVAGDAGMGGAVAAAGTSGAGGTSSAGAAGQTASVGGSGGRAGGGTGGAALAGRGGAGAGGNGGNAADDVVGETEGGCAVGDRTGSGSRSGATAALLLGLGALLRRRRAGRAAG